MNVMLMSCACDFFGIPSFITGIVEAEENRDSQDYATNVNRSNVEQTNETNAWIAQQTNESNERMNAETNAANRAAVESTNQANRDIAQQTNDTNMAINQANIDYQNAYNQQIFEREDTAYERAAKDAASVGINPLTLSQGAASGGQAVAPQATLGAQSGAAMQAPRDNAHKNMAYQMEAFQQAPTMISGLSDIFKGMSNAMGNLAQFDIQREQAKRLQNENEFFDENGYYPQQMSDLERIATLFTNVLDGKGKGGEIRDKVDNTLNDVVGADSREILDFVKDSAKDGLNSIRDFGKGVGAVPGIVKGIYDDVKQAESGDKLSTLGDSIIDFGKDIGDKSIHLQLPFAYFF